MKGENKKFKNEINYKLLLVIKFLVLFNLFSIPMYIVIYFNLSSLEFQKFVAFLSSSLLNIIGYKNYLTENEVLIKVDDTIKSVYISWDSTGWKSVYAIFSLILATPMVKISRKIYHVAIFMPTVFFINILRIITTIILSIYHNFLDFEFIHIFLWRYLLIGTIVLLWLIFLKRERII
jgi:exosortase/archaeosortase family protein